jgi:hypothetical protein
MKFFKQITVAALVVFLLSMISRTNTQVEVIPGGLNPVNGIDYGNKVVEIAPGMMNL